MAALIPRLRSKSNILCFYARTELQTRWQTTAQTLNVKQRIEDTRQKALLGGGEKRIASQHKKVSPVANALCTCKL